MVLEVVLVVLEVVLQLLLLQLLLLQLLLLQLRVLLKLQTPPSKKMSKHHEKTFPIYELDLPDPILRVPEPKKRNFGDFFCKSSKSRLSNP